MNVTGIIHTKNSADTLERLFSSIDWIDEKIVVDMGSTDETLEIAKRYDAKIYSVDDVPRVDGLRNQFLDKGSSEWVFVLDSDEYLSADAEQEVGSLLKDYGRSYDAFAIPRYNEIAGKVVRGSGWYPDQQVRLFRKGVVRWSDSTHQPPEVLSGSQRLLRLDPPDCLHIHHTNYKDLQQFIERQLSYAVNDVYDDSSETFAFDDYVADAYQQFAFRSEGSAGDDLSYALATIMAWDRVVRGVIHWDRLGRKTRLARAFSLPIATTSFNGGARASEELIERNKQLEAQLEAVRSGLLWKCSNMLGQRLPVLKRVAKRILEPLR